VIYIRPRVLALQCSIVCRLYPANGKVSRYWQGLLPAIAFSVAAFVVDVCSYREIKRWLGIDTTATYLLVSAVAQITSSVFWTPMNIVCGRLQLRHPGLNQSFLKEIQHIYSHEKLTGFFMGYWLGVGIYLPYTVAW